MTDEVLRGNVVLEKNANRRFWACNIFDKWLQLSKVEWGDKRGSIMTMQLPCSGNFKSLL